MSSPKRSLHEVEGYLHEVSEVMQSQSSSARYFTALLQEADKTSRVVVFDLTKRDSLLRAAKDRSPVKLTGVGLSPAKGKNASDVLINSRSVFSVVRRLSFDFVDRPSTNSLVHSLTDVLNDVRDFQRVTVIVKMICSLDDKWTTVRGQRLRCNSIVVADATELLLLSVWGQHEVDFGCWYKMDNLSVRQFNGMTILSTTLQSTFGKVDDRSVTKEFTDEVRTVVGEILEAQVKVEHYCSRHHLLNNVDMSTLMTLCDRCQVFCKNSNSATELRGNVTIIVDSAHEKILLDDMQIRELLSIKPGDTVESHSLTAAILANVNLSVTMWRKFAIKLSFADLVSTAVLCPVPEQASGSGTQTALVHDEETEGLDELDKLFEEY